MLFSGAKLEKVSKVSFDGGLGPEGPQILSGAASTRAAVKAEVDADNSLSIGSMYISTVSGATTLPKVYVKRAAANAATDWERLVSAATD